ncbi:hypothetical protein [Sphingomonas rubra]|uniref:Uncharacterized protein n=1 Tax=Sphingomonas rubra TaxID=634430 RepID=A0A1I5UGW9_9SPHN|nr:hypothetical protein [Sphingomonas rubra]SFP94502.1 hypothetical protein SAMN04488241_111177 [Sphingomonas rubra]
MALEDFLALADDSLKTAYHKASFNIEKARADVVTRLKKAEEQFMATEPARGRKMFKVNNNVVELTLPFNVDGKNVLYIPSERFVDAVKKLSDAVGKGEVDKEIEAGAPSEPENKPRARAPRATGSGGGKGWTDERRARFAETIAARKASR